MSVSSNKNPHIAYKDFHWGCLPTREIEPEDKRLPKYLIEIGLLLELRIRGFDKKKFRIEITEDDYNNNHVVFDVKHKFQRMYIVLSNESLKASRKLWNDNSDSYKLSDVAKRVGSKHGTKDYLNIMVQPLGYLENIVYFTEKKGDGKSGYIHRMGEEGGVEPVLCLDKNGNLWIAGGSYTCPDPGITN